MDEYKLIDMLFDRCPIEEFYQLWESQEELDWSGLLHMCYCEESYERVGGDEGNMQNSPINHERIAYLNNLIALLESCGIKEKI